MEWECGCVNAVAVYPHQPLHLRVQGSLCILFSYYLYLVVWVLHPGLHCKRFDIILFPNVRIRICSINLTEFWYNSFPRCHYTDILSTFEWQKMPILHFELGFQITLAWLCFVLSLTTWVNHPFVPNNLSKAYKLSPQTTLTCCFHYKTVLNCNTRLRLYWSIYMTRIRGRTMVHILLNFWWCFYNLLILGWGKIIIVDTGALVDWIISSMCHYHYYCYYCNSLILFAYVTLLAGQKMMVGISLVSCAHVMVFSFASPSCFHVTIGLSNFFLYHVGPSSPISKDLCGWKDYYEWRSIPLHSPIALLLHWVRYVWC